MPKYRLMILGVGNVLLTDEGIGVHAIQALQKQEWPEGVFLLDGGTLGVDLLPYLEYAPKIVVIDAVKAGSEPGAMYRFTPAILREHREEALSLHQVGFLEVLDLSAHMGYEPQAIIFGVQPAEMSLGVGLSATLQGILPRLLELVTEEVHRWLAEEEADPA